MTVILVEKYNYVQMGMEGKNFIVKIDLDIKLGWKNYAVNALPANEIEALFNILLLEGYDLFNNGVRVKGREG